MPLVPDIYEYCEEGDRAKAPVPECFKYWCDLTENLENADCEVLWEFCDGNDGDNWDLPECTPPCEMEANLENPKCSPPEEPGEPEDGQRRR